MVDSVGSFVALASPSAVLVTGASFGFSSDCVVVGAGVGSAADAPVVEDAGGLGVAGSVEISRSLLSSWYAIYPLTEADSHPWEIQLLLLLLHQTPASVQELEVGVICGPLQR